MSSSDAGTAKGTLRILATSGLTEIRLTDARLRDIALSANTGEVEVELNPGVYQVGFREGSSWQYQHVLLTGNAPMIVQQSPPPPSPDVDEDEPASDTGARSGVMIVVKRDTAEPSPADPLAGLSLVSDDGATIASGPPHYRERSARMDFDVAPGHWRLRLQTGTDGRDLESAIVVCPGWRTMVELSLREYGDERRADLGAAVVRMVPAEMAPSDVDQRTRQIETHALEALARRRSLHGRRFNELLRTLLPGKFQNPMLGLYGGYLLPLRTEEEIGVLAEVIANLARLTQQGPFGNENAPGPLHPDVAALSLRLALARDAGFDAVEPFSLPPMLLASWEVVLQAAKRRRGLVPRRSLSDRIAGRLWGAGPWLVWSRADERRRRSTESIDGWRVTREARAVFRGVAPLEAVSEDRESAVFDADESAEDAFEVESVPEACEVIGAALRHASLRRWFRERAEDGRLSPEEVLVANAIHPVAADETRQEKLRSLDARARTPPRPPSTAESLSAELRLPPTTAERAALELCARLLQEGRKLDIDLRTRYTMSRPELIIPYDPDFLGDGFQVPLPALTDGVRASAFADGTVLDYTHFSLVMHVGRRTALYTAHNVDASRGVRVKGGLGWKMDERVGEFQLGPEVYADNQLDRGHLVRREDVLWGTVAEARLANKSTFFYTNAAPQHRHFNQDEWVTLEDWVLHDATDFSYRLCVFTGPVLRPDDPVLSDLPAHLRAAYRAAGRAQIPAAFWKVIILRDATAGGDDLSAVSFAMKQSEMWEDNDGRRLLHLKVHQVTLDAIERWTGLDFGDLKNVDELAWSEERTRMRDAAHEAAWPLIRSSDDIVYSRQTRRLRGLRATRSVDSAARMAPSGAAPTAARLAGDLRAEGCGCGDGEFDARTAIAALSRDVARLTDAMSGASPAAGPLERSVERGAAMTRDASPPAATSTATPDPQIEEVVSRAPAADRDRWRTFAASVARQADIAQGRVPAPEPTALGRIVGGDNVPFGGFPSCCCIGSATDWFCTGVVVAPRVVLTAAHCGRNMTRVMVGGNQVLPGLDAGARVIAVRHVLVHPRYRGRPFHENDISVLVLDSDALVVPVALAEDSHLAQAAEVELVGFGYNDPMRPVGLGTKRQVRAPLAPVPGSNTGELESLASLLGFHTDYEFVAGRKALGRDSCNGDSGGPAYVRAAGAVLVAGLTSRATRSSTVNCGDGGIYVRPSRFRTWINETLVGVGLGAIPT